jgi:tetratricopeptide (TPR) repeat protein
MRRLFAAAHFHAYLRAGVLCVLTIAAYHPAWNGGFVWDDDAYVTKNPLLTASDGLRRIWFSLDSPSQYFPLVYTTFRIERALWDLNPTGYHWVNILLHVANALFVWRLLIRLKVPGAWLAAAIFALHPVQVESVAWITERKNVLMGFFFLLTLLAWVEYVDLRASRRWFFYAAALILYLLALSAKTTACTLPAALLLVLWLQKIPITCRRLLQVIPFLLLGLGMGLIAVWWERYHQGTRGALFALGPMERLLVASHAFWFYLSKLFWPSNLTFIYPQWSVHARDALAYLWLFATGGLCAAIYFARRLFGRSVEVAALFFVTTLSPLLGFIMLYTFRYTFVADHYQYLASIGPIALVSAGLTRLSDSIKHGRQLIWPASTSIIIALALLTWRQSATYRDIETLWRTTIARNPSCWMAYNNLGIALVERGEVDEAISQYERSLQLHSDYAQAHYNLGIALLQKRKVGQAIAQCQEALRLQPNDRDAHVALGNALLTSEDVDGAIAHYSRALELHPDDSDAHYNLGNALLAKGEAVEAIVHYQKALELRPNIAEAHLQLGNVFLQNNDARRAIAYYEEALKISPHSPIAQTYLAWALASASDRSLRNSARAIELAEAANRSFRGEDAITLHALAAGYAENGQFGKAIEIARRALQLAQRQNETALADELGREIELYRAGSPYREP